MQHDVTRAYFELSLGSAHGAVTGEEYKQLPLHAVAVIGTDGGTGSDAPDLQIKRMSALLHASITDAAEGQRNVAAVTAVAAFG